MLKQILKTQASRALVASIRNSKTEIEAESLLVAFLNAYEESIKNNASLYDIKVTIINGIDEDEISIVR